MTCVNCQRRIEVGSLLCNACRPTLEHRHSIIEEENERLDQAIQRALAEATR